MANIKLNKNIQYKINQHVTALNTNDGHDEDCNVFFGICCECCCTCCNCLKKLTITIQGWEDYIPIGNRRCNGCNFLNKTIEMPITHYYDGLDYHDEKKENGHWYHWCIKGGNDDLIDPCNPCSPNIPLVNTCGKQTFYFCNDQWGTDATFCTIQWELYCDHEGLGFWLEQSSPYNHIWGQGGWPSGVGVHAVAYLFPSEGMTCDTLADYLTDLPLVVSPQYDYGECNAGSATVTVTPDFASSPSDECDNYFLCHPRPTSFRMLNVKEIPKIIDQKFNFIKDNPPKINNYNLEKKELYSYNYKPKILYVSNYPDSDQTLKGKQYQKYLYQFDIDITYGVDWKSAILQKKYDVICFLNEKIVDHDFIKKQNKIGTQVIISKYFFVDKSNIIKNKNIFSSYNGLSTNNHLTYKNFINNGFNNPFKILDGINLNVFGIDKNFENRKFKIVFISNVEDIKYKGYDIWNEIKNKMPNFSEGIEFLEIITTNNYNITPEEMNEIYNECKILISFNPPEFNSTNVLEASACGVVSITTPHENCDYFKNIYIIEKTEHIAQDYMTRILYLKNNPKILNDMSKGISQEILAWDDKNLCNQWGEFIQQTLINKKGLSLL